MCCCVLFYIHDRNLAPSLKFEKQQVCATNEVIVGAPSVPISDQTVSTNASKPSGDTQKVPLICSYDMEIQGFPYRY